MAVQLDKEKVNLPTNEEHLKQIISGSSPDRYCLENQKFFEKFLI